MRSAIAAARGVVRDHHDRLAELVDRVAQQLEDLAARRGVEVAGRLVGEDDRRPRDERAGDRDALLLAAGELGRSVRAAVGEADRSSSSSNHSWSGFSPAIESGSRMFSSAVSIGSRLKNWKTKPMCSRRSLRQRRCRRASMISVPAIVDRRREVGLSSAGEDVHQRRLARSPTAP